MSVEVKIDFLLEAATIPFAKADCFIGETFSLLGLELFEPELEAFEPELEVFSMTLFFLKTTGSGSGGGLFFLYLMAGSSSAT